MPLTQLAPRIPRSLLQTRYSTAFYRPRSLNNRSRAYSVPKPIQTLSMENKTVTQTETAMEKNVTTEKETAVKKTTQPRVLEEKSKPIHPEGFR